MGVAAEGVVAAGVAAVVEAEKQSCGGYCPVDAISAGRARGTMDGGDV